MFFPFWTSLEHFLHDDMIFSRSIPLVINVGSIAMIITGPSRSYEMLVSPQLMPNTELAWKWRSPWLYFCKKFTNIVHNFLNIQYTDLCNQLKWRSWKTLSITHIIFIKCLRFLILFEFSKFLNFFLYLITYSVDLLNSKNNRALQVPFTVGACSTRSLKSEL